MTAHSWRFRATRDLCLSSAERGTMMCIPKGAAVEVLYFTTLPDGSSAAYVDAGEWSGYVAEDAIEETP